MYVDSPCTLNKPRLTQVSVVILDKRLWFPDPRHALNIGTLNGLVALGGDLSKERLLLAYRSGIFPWSVDPITWWSPDPRGVFELDAFHVSRSLRRTLRKRRFCITVNRAFREVMAACAAVAEGRRNSWITPEFQHAYGRLHEAGHAHSVECWSGDQLVGGVYGVQTGGLFAGESMFHRADDASKVALHSLVEHLRDRGFVLFDTQMVTPHTERLGAVSIPRQVYLERLAEAVRLDRQFTTDRPS
jgi:leucyl/phenylalanyl-tRNA---protein transferase